MTPFRYADKTPASDYFCYGCKQHGVKLWRESGFFFADEMRCATCVALYAKKEGHPIPLFDGQGIFREAGYPPSNQFRLYMPCVPAEDGTVWNYNGTPHAGWVWWESLPTYPKE